MSVVVWCGDECGSASYAACPLRRAPQEASEAQKKAQGFAALG
jgi:hypothetical protein